MTEEEWLGWCGISDKILEFLRGKPGLGRQRRLLAVACCNRVLKWMPQQCLPAVAMAEKGVGNPLSLTIAASGDCMSVAAGSWTWFWGKS